MDLATTGWDLGTDGDCSRHDCEHKFEGTVAVY